MGKTNFSKPIILRLNHGHADSFRVRNAADALEYLSRFWSSDRTREYRRAYALCQSALDNLVSAESARAYVVVAAERAGILYRQRAYSGTAGRHSRV